MEERMDDPNIKRKIMQNRGLDGFHPVECDPSGPLSKLPARYLHNPISSFLLKFW